MNGTAACGDYLKRLGFAPLNGFRPFPKRVLRKAWREPHVWSDYLCDWEPVSAQVQRQALRAMEIAVNG